MTFWISIIFIETFREQSICKWVSWWCHRLTIFHVFCSQKWWKSYEKIKLTLYPLWMDAEECLLWYVMIWGHAFTCLSKKRGNFHNFIQDTWKIVRRWDHQLNSFPYSYWLFKKCFVEKYKNKKFHIFLIFYPIYIKFSLFYSKCFNLSIELI